MRSSTRLSRVAGFAFLAISAAGLTGCIGNLFNVNLFVVGEQTALEKQVLGTYNALGEDLLLYSSVRGVDPDGKLRPAPERTESQEATFSAMRNRTYNRDDVEAILAAQVAGESNNGTVESRPGGPETVAGLTREQILAVIEEENADRQTILQRLMQTTPGVTDAQRPEVAWVFASLNQDTAPSGSWIQSRDGNWSRK